MQVDSKAYRRRRRRKKFIGDDSFPILKAHSEGSDFEPISGWDTSTPHSHVRLLQAYGINSFFASPPSNSASFLRQARASDHKKELEVFHLFKRMAVTAPAESDSFTDNPAPSQRPRRLKRRVKKMAISPTPSSSFDLDCYETLVRGHRMRNSRKSPPKAFPNMMDGLDSFMVPPFPYGSFSFNFHRPDDCCSISSNDSSLGSEHDIFTNDEGREGDDEQSESGFCEDDSTESVLGIPVSIPWWEREEQLEASESSFSESLNKMTPLVSWHSENCSHTSTQTLPKSLKREREQPIGNWCGTDVNSSESQETVLGCSHSFKRCKRQPCCSGTSRLLKARRPRFTPGSAKRKKNRRRDLQIQKEERESPLSEENSSSNLLRHMQWEPGLSKPGDNFTPMFANFKFGMEIPIT